MPIDCYSICSGGETVPVCHGKQRADHESKALDIDQSVFLRPSMSKSIISDWKIVFIDVYDGNPLPLRYGWGDQSCGRAVASPHQNGCERWWGVMGANITLLQQRPFSSSVLTKHSWITTNTWQHVTVTQYWLKSYSVKTTKLFKVKKYNILQWPKIC